MSSFAPTPFFRSITFWRGHCILFRVAIVQYFSHILFRSNCYQWSLVFIFRTLWALHVSPKLKLGRIPQLTVYSWKFQVQKMASGSQKKQIGKNSTDLNSDGKKTIYELSLLRPLKYPKTKEHAYTTTQTIKTPPSYFTHTKLGILKKYGFWPDVKLRSNSIFSVHHFLKRPLHFISCRNSPILLKYSLYI